MSLSSATVWEVRSGSSDTNGGGFVAGASGTDFSQQNSKNTVGNNISTTDAVANGTATLTSATAAFTAAIVGNIIYLSGGSGSIAAGWYQVTAFTNATTITIDRTIAASTGMTLNIGGALASPGQAGAVLVSGNIIWIAAGTYLITSAITNVSGGCLSVSVSCGVEGYSSSRGDLGTPPVLQASGISSATLLARTAQNGYFRNITVDGQSLTAICGVKSDDGGNPSYIDKVTAKNCTNSGIISNRGFLARCVATGCSTTGAGISCSSAWMCESHDNTVTGFSYAGQASAGLLVRCLSYNNSGSSSDGFQLGNYFHAVECSAYNNGRDGFRANGSGGAYCAYCVSEHNIGVGFNTSNTVTNATSLVNCAGYQNTGGDIGGTPYYNVGFIHATAEIFNNAAGTDFSPNNTGGGGAAIRGVSITFPVASTTSYEDLGAAQSQATGGSGGIPNYGIRTGGRM